MTVQCVAVVLYHPSLTSVFPVNVCLLSLLATIDTYVYATIYHYLTESPLALFDNEPGWNDPPPVSYQDRTSGAKHPSVLQPRVPYPVESQTSTTNMHGIRKHSILILHRQISIPIVSLPLLQSCHVRICNPVRILHTAMTLD